MEQEDRGNLEIGDLVKVVEFGNIARVLVMLEYEAAVVSEDHPTTGMVSWVYYENLRRL